MEKTKESIFAKRNAIMAIGALLLLIVSIIIENPIYHLEHGVEVYNFEIASSLFREISFALIIALVVSYGIERQARAQDNENSDRMRQQIAADVFSGVFSKFLPSAYVVHVIKSALNYNIIREEMRVIIEIHNLTKEQKDFLGENSKDLIQLKTTMIFTLKNISIIPIKHAVRCHYLNKFSLPDAMCGLRSVFIKQREFNLDEIELGKIPSFDKKSTTYEWNVDINKEESINIRIEGIVLKKIEDDEIITNILPTMKFEMSINNHIPGLEASVISRSSSSLEKSYSSDDSGLTEVKLSNPMLPYESVVVWWAKKRQAPTI